MTINGLCHGFFYESYKTKSFLYFCKHKYVRKIIGMSRNFRSKYTYSAIHHSRFAFLFFSVLIKVKDKFVVNVCKKNTYTKVEVEMLLNSFKGDFSWIHRYLLFQQLQNLNLMYHHIWWGCRENII